MYRSHSFARFFAVAAILTTATFFSASANAQNPMTGAPTPVPAVQPTAQAPAAAPTGVPGGAPAPQQVSLCGNQPFCYESQDFVATLMDFRTSMAGYYKVLDATIRFQNKTTTPLALGYTSGSGAALDDRGLRYAVGGGNPVRGMGLVNGQTADPRFVLRPGGFGDVRFELLGSAQIYGMTYELNLTVNEINLIEGNQHTVGSEFPLQFQGLANGVRGTAPGIPAGGIPGISSMMAGATSQTCGAAGTLTNVAAATNNAGAQNAANTATSTVSSATAAVNSLKSIFGRKPAAAAPAQTAAATPACVPATPAVAVPAAAPNAAAAATTAVSNAPAAISNAATAINPMNSAATTAPAATPAAAKAPAATPSKPAATAAKPATPPAKPAAKKPVTPAQAAPAAVPPQTK